jgi:hypothetical protein
MARIEGVTRGGSLWARLAFFLTRRKVGRVVRPVQIQALHPCLLWGTGQMELALEKATLVSAILKALASVRAATLIGCPF